MQIVTAFEVKPGDGLPRKCEPEYFVFYLQILALDCRSANDHTLVICPENERVSIAEHFGYLVVVISNQLILEWNNGFDLRSYCLGFRIPHLGIYADSSESFRNNSNSACAMAMCPVRMAFQVIFLCLSILTTRKLSGLLSSNRME